jgi:hypothetical protein
MKKWRRREKSTFTDTDAHLLLLTGRVVVAMHLCMYVCTCVCVDGVSLAIAWVSGVQGAFHGNSSLTSGVSPSTAATTKSTSDVGITAGVVGGLILRGDLGNEAVACCCEGRFPGGGTGPFCGEGDRRF